MEAKELRIGNYYIYKEGDKQDNSAECQYLGTKWTQDGTGYEFSHLTGQKGLTIYPSKFQPIKLTEEWLIKFGFEEKQNRAYKKYWKDFGDLAILVDDDFDFYVHCESYEGETLRHIDYVHTLQNLYFALTGEELTINE
jgi:hypothetical protein